jgi:hypothetical protein
MERALWLISALVLGGMSIVIFRGGDNRLIGLTLVGWTCCLFPLGCVAGGWYLRKFAREGWRPTLTGKPKQEEL